MRNSGVRPSSAASSVLTRGTLVLVVALAVAALTGCSTTIDRPAAFPGTQRAKGVTYADAVDYLNTARANLQAALTNADRFDTATKAGVGLGVGGAGISAVFRSAINPILGFISFAGLNYAANQIVDPQTLAGIYSAGLMNLDCIDDAGTAARQSTAALSNRYEDLTSAMQALENDVTRALASHTPRLYSVDIDRARKNLAKAEGVRRGLRDYLASNTVAEAMISGVNSTLTAVNQQLREKSPSIDAIAKSGSIFGSFINLNAGLKSQTQLAISNFQRPTGATQGAEDPIEVSFLQDEATLDAVLSQIPAHLDPPSLAAITRCQTQFAADSPVTIQPPGPLDLNAGNSLSLTSSGKPPYRLQWSGNVPSDVDVNIAFDQITLTAKPGAQEQSYSFRVIDFLNKGSSDAQLKVHAKSADASGAKKSSTQQRGNEEDQIIKTKGFAAVAKALGLNSAEVTDRNNPAWKSRVNFLESCVGITPTTGMVSTNLLTKLNGSDCVSRAPAPAPVAAPQPATNAPATTTSPGSLAPPTPENR